MPRRSPDRSRPRGSMAIYGLPQSRLRHAEKGGPDDPLEDVQIGVESNVEKRETIGEIFRLLEELPKNQREVVCLKFQCDLSYKEISEVTKLSVSNVGFLIHTALKTIRKRVLSEPARRNQ